MCKSLSIFIIFYLSLHHAQARSHQVADVQTNNTDNHFDILIFSQKWPVTYCKQWLLDTKGHCVFPKKKYQWTVHGIWPWTMEHDFPEYCNNSWAFDPKQIKSIEGDLEQAWTNIFKEQERYKFWEHEWLRHGTCAAVLKPFSTQLKFFSKGIEWNQKYSLLDMLNAAKIFPSDTKEYNPEEFVNAVKAKTKKNPMVVCHKYDRDDENEVPSLWELRICLDKQFYLVDCQTVVEKHSCSGSKVIFPANVI